MKELTTDYLVIGSGAMGMAFCDVLLTETDANILIVDRHHQPGGHWNDAYPFVRLHQPSAFYGVNSKKLGNNTVDVTGWNSGLYELATNGEVCTYFDQVMQRQFLSSGRVQYFPSCDYLGDGEFASLLSNQTFKVSYSKEVDASYMNVVVPSKRAPSYKLDENVHCVPPNSLPLTSQEFNRYVLIGAGKTAMDAALFLLKNEVPTDKITWIMPRDSWILDRAHIQPTFESMGSAFAAQTVAGAEAETIDDFFEKIWRAGGLLRLDDSVKPTMYRCATITTAELTQLQRLKDIVRLGRVKSIKETEIILEQGTIPTGPKVLHVDCTGDGLAKRAPVPIFNNNKITLQSVRTCQQVFSAAFIGHVEAAYLEEDEKNDICKPVPHPNTDIDFLRNNLADTVNTTRWQAEPKLQKWLQTSRLDAFSHLLSSKPSAKLMMFLSKLPFVPVKDRFTSVQEKATKRIEKLLNELDA
jgi:hypothetical protein|tara:strand:+ start:1934 stop:3340 length:1407 start_codon:yes stop_codon:yes gene_type:complete